MVSDILSYRKGIKLIFHETMFHIVYRGTEKVNWFGINNNLISPR